MTSQRSTPSETPISSQGAAGRLPDFLILGAQRCGTTSLARHLAAHPEVFVASQKEVHFFDRHFSRGLEWYGQQFAPGSDAKVVGEATPEYMYDQDAFARVADTVPEAKLIVSLRNPVDRAYSDYCFVHGRGYESLSFKDAIAAEDTRIASGDPLERMRYAYADRGHYLVQLRRIRRSYASENLLVVVFEDFVRDPTEALRRIHRFIGVSEDFVPRNLGRRFGSARTYRSQRLRQLARALPYPFGAGVSRLNARTDSYPPMDSQVRESLEKRFEHDNRALAEWLGIDLSVWESPAQTDSHTGT